MISPQATTQILNATLKSINDIIPLPVEIGKPSLVSSPSTQCNYSVLITVIGDETVRLLLDTNEKILQTIAEKMFGMVVDGNLLSSFLGELGNMIGGTMCTHVSTDGLHLDITPPTVLIGNTTISGFKKGIKVPVNLDGSEVISIMIGID